MIVAVHGVPGMSFAEVTYMLTDLGIGYVAVTDRPQKIGNPSSGHVIPVVFSSVKQFMDSRSKIKFRAVTFVCDSFHKLHTEMKIPVVGVEITKKGPVYTPFSKNDLGSLLQAADRLKEPTNLEIEFRPHEPTRRMIRKFSESALSQAQTVVYRVKNQELRSKTFGLIRDWFLGKVKSKESLRLKINALHKNEKYSADLERILLSAHGMALRDSVIEVQKNPARIEVVCKKNKISPFDVRYLMSKGDR